MKALFSIACAAIILAVGYHFWDGYAKRQAYAKQAFSESCDRLLAEGKNIDVQALTDADRNRRHKQLSDCIAFIRDGNLP